MDTNLPNPTPTSAPVATPTQAPAADTGTVQPSGDASGVQGASAEEMFGNVDPRTLPPQLKSVYDNMLRGFKEKTTKLSETVKSETAKATEAFKQKADLYEQFATNEDFVKQWNSYVEKVNSNVNANPDDPVAKMEKKMQINLKK